MPTATATPTEVNQKFFALDEIMDGIQHPILPKHHEVMRKIIQKELERNQSSPPDWAIIKRITETVSQLSQHNISAADLWDVYEDLAAPVEVAVNSSDLCSIVAAFIISDWSEASPRMIDEKLGWSEGTTKRVVDEYEKKAHDLDKPWAFKIVNGIVHPNSGLGVSIATTSSEIDNWGDKAANAKHFNDNIGAMVRCHLEDLGISQADLWEAYIKIKDTRTAKEEHDFASDVISMLCLSVKTPWIPMPLEMIDEVLGWNPGRSCMSLSKHLKSTNTPSILLVESPEPGVILNLNLKFLVEKMCYAIRHSMSYEKESIIEVSEAIGTSADEFWKAYATAKRIMESQTGWSMVNGCWRKNTAPQAVVALPELSTETITELAMTQKKRLPIEEKNGINEIKLSPLQYLVCCVVNYLWTTSGVMIPISSDACMSVIESRIGRDRLTKSRLEYAIRNFSYNPFFEPNGTVIYTSRDRAQVLREFLSKKRDLDAWLAQDPKALNPFEVISIPHPDSHSVMVRFLGDNEIQDDVLKEALEIAMNQVQEESGRHASSIFFSADIKIPVETLKVEMKNELKKVKLSGWPQTNQKSPKMHRTFMVVA